MPNWCENLVTIKHSDPQQLKNLAEQASKGNLLNFIKPMPNGVWDYDWCVANWGTKWEPHAETMKVEWEGDDLVLNFLSAWEPPINIYYQLVKDDFEVVAYYCELNMDYCGKFKGDKHEVTEEEYDDVTSGNIPSDIDDALDISWQIERELEFEKAEEMGS